MIFSSNELYLLMETELAKINKELIDQEKEILAKKIKKNLNDYNVNFEIGEKGGKIYFEFFV